MKSKTLFNLLISFSFISASCYYSIAFNSSQTNNLTINALICKLSQAPKNTIKEGCKELKTPIKLLKNDHVPSALNFVRSITFSPHRFLSYEKNGWEIETRVDGAITHPFDIINQDYDLLNRQTAIVLDIQTITFYPIRPRSSNGPPVL